MRKLVQYFLLTTLGFAVGFLCPAFVSKVFAADSCTRVYRGVNQLGGCGEASGDVYDCGLAELRPAPGDTTGYSWSGFWHTGIPTFGTGQNNNRCDSNIETLGYVFPNNEGVHKAKFTLWQCRNNDNGNKVPCTVYNIPYCGSFAYDSTKVNNVNHYLSEFNDPENIGEHIQCSPGDVTGIWYDHDPTTGVETVRHWTCTNNIIDSLSNIYGTGRTCDTFPSEANHLGNSCLYSTAFTTKAALQADWRARRPSCKAFLKINGVCGVCDLDGVGTCLSGIPGTVQGQPDDPIWQCSGINGGLNNLEKATDTTSQPHCKCKKNGAKPSISCTIRPIYGAAALSVEATVGVLFPGFKETVLIPHYGFQIDFNYGQTPTVKAYLSNNDADDLSYTFPRFTYTKSGKYQVYYNIQDSMGKYAPCLDHTPSPLGDGWCRCGEVEVRKQTSGSSSEVAP
jgi:hypothetical protein